MIEHEPSQLTPRQNKAVLAYMAHASGTAQLAQIVERNQAAIEQLEHMRKNDLPVVPDVMIGCPHCAPTMPCHPCMWRTAFVDAAAISKDYYVVAPCCSARFGGVSHRDISAAARPPERSTVAYGHDRVVLNLDPDTTQDDYNNALAFLRGHVEWAQAELDVRAACNVGEVLDGET